MLSPLCSSETIDQEYQIGVLPIWTLDYICDPLGCVWVGLVALNVLGCYAARHLHGEGRPALRRLN
jgi:hypothetical protein